jgi:hypothetical protein
MALSGRLDALEPLQALMNHSRIDTTQVYLRALNRSKAMEAVRDLSWGSGFQSRGEKAHKGFEPGRARLLRRLPGALYVRVVCRT